MHVPESSIPKSIVVKEVVVVWRGGCRGEKEKVASGGCRGGDVAATLRCEGRCDDRRSFLRHIEESEDEVEERTENDHRLSAVYFLRRHRNKDVRSPIWLGAALQSPGGSCVHSLQCRGRDALENANSAITFDAQDSKSCSFDHTTAADLGSWSIDTAQSP